MPETLQTLMCKPDYYGINWQDPKKNPWMNKDQQPDRMWVMLQWTNLVGLLQNLFGESNVNFLPPQPGLGDQVFTCNDAGLFELESGRKVFVKANPAPEERKPESEIAAQWLRERGCNVYTLPEHLIFEGQGDIITTKEAYLYCYGIRNSRETMEEIEKTFKLSKPVIYLELVDPHFYHGDMAIRYSRFRDAVLFYPGAFSAESMRRIENLRAHKKEMREQWLVQEIERNGKLFGRNFPLNGCYIGRVETFPWNEFYGEFPRELRSWVESGGCEVKPIDYSQFGLSGAGHRCTVLFLD